MKQIISDPYDRIEFEAFASNGVEISRAYISGQRIQGQDGYHNGCLDDMWQAWKKAIDHTTKKLRRQNEAHRNDRTGVSAVEGRPGKAVERQSKNP